MQATPAAQTKLPDIALSDLPESTKDFLIAHSATGKAVPQVIRETLNHAAERAGFSPEPAAETSTPETPTENAG